MGVPPILLGLLASLAVGCARPERAAPPGGGASSGSTHGVVVGEVTPHSAVVWGRGRGEGMLHAALRPRGGLRIVHTARPVRPTRDFTAKFLFEDLVPSTEYEAHVWWTELDAPVRSIPRYTEQARFRTAPAPSAAVPVRFAVGGDVGGQNACRDREDGYPIFATIASLHPDFFIGLGDMIYADDVCEATGYFGNAQVPGDYPASTTLADYWAHWRYNRADPATRELLSNTAYYAVWDDHEVANDSGPFDALQPVGYAAFLHYNPIDESEGTQARLYRKVRWGRNVEVFILDTRGHRDPNAAADDGPVPKTLLGEEQRKWLEEGLASSDATWKILITSVPLSVPTGFPIAGGRDGWADAGNPTGFERRLRELMAFLRDRGIRNTLWLATDVHFATAFRYRPIADDPEFVTYELITGPLNARLFPNRELDETLRPERLFFFGPESIDAVTDYAEALTWFNFGWIEVDEAGALTFSVRGVDGREIFSQRLEPMRD